LESSPQGFYKVNFDGFSKGSLVQEGYGEVIRDSSSQIQYLMVEHLGHDMNNSIELWGLIKGIQMAYDINMNYLRIEGDSKIIISLESKIINGNDPEKITPRWRLMGPLNNLQALL